MTVFNMSGGAGTMSINGLRIEVRGGQVYVEGRLYGPVDGKPVPAPAPSQQKLTLDKNGRVCGDVGGDLVVEGENVTLVIEGSVQGSVSSSGPVTANAIYGSINAGGDVVVRGSVFGSVNAGGHVRR